MIDRQTTATTSGRTATSDEQTAEVTKGQATTTGQATMMTDGRATVTIDEQTDGQTMETTEGQATTTGQVMMTMEGQRTTDGQTMTTTAVEEVTLAVEVDPLAVMDEQTATMTTVEEMTLAVEVDPLAVMVEQATTNDGRIAAANDGQAMTSDGRTTEMTDGQTLIIEALDGQGMATDSHSEVVLMDEAAGTSDVLTVDGQPLTPAAGEEAVMQVEVDPLACPMSSSFLSADEADFSPISGTPRKLVSCASATPRQVFLSPTESTPSVSGPVRNMFESLGVDTKTGIVAKGRRIAGRKQAVIEDDDDVETLSSTSAASVGLDSSSMASSARAPKKGVKRGREVSKDKDYRKKGKSEGSNEENKRKRKGKKKETGRKETPEETESYGACGEPKGIVDLVIEDMSSSVLGGAMMEWANRIDEIRVKSKNLQGKLNGEMKRCVSKIKEGTTLLVILSEASGDQHFLRMRNLELTTQLRELERDNARLEEQLRRMSSGSPSPLRKRRAVKTAVMDVPLVDLDDPVDLPSREEFPPLPQRTPRSGEVKDGTKEKVGPRIVSDVQVAPPFKERRIVETATPAVSGPEDEWRVAAGSRRRGRVKGDGPPPPPPPVPPVLAKRQPLIKQQLQQPKARLPRPPVSSAVTITGRSEGFSYAEAMRSARENIDLGALGIRTSRVRKALNGGLLIEVSGEDSRLKAEELVTRLRGVLKDSAAVACPIKKRELSVVGFDESVTIDEIVDALSNLGGCPKADIKTGPIRTMSNGLGMLWVQLPVAAAAKVAEEGRVRVGWTMARVELLKVRPLQCFKCWGFGHVQNMCRSVVDRREACFRCGQKGHMAGNCKNSVHCAVCHDAGLVASPRLGGPQCTAQDRQDK